VYCAVLALLYFSELFHLNGHDEHASFTAYPVCQFNILMFSFCVTSRFALYLKDFCYHVTGAFAINRTPLAAWTDEIFSFGRFL